MSLRKQKRPKRIHKGFDRLSCDLIQHIATFQTAKERVRWSCCDSTIHHALDTEAWRGTVFLSPPSHVYPHPPSPQDLYITSLQHVETLCIPSSLEWMMDILHTCSSRLQSLRIVPTSGFLDTSINFSLLLLSRVCTNITSLNLEHQEKLYDDALQQVLHACGPNMKTLNLAQCFHLSATGLASSLKNCPNLISIDLTRLVHIISNREFMKQLAKSCPHLEVLKLSHFSIRTQPFLQDITKHCQRLKRVELNFISGDLQQDMDGLLSRCPSLSHLELKSTLLNDEWIETMPPCPSMRYMDLSDTHLTEKGLVRLSEKCPQLTHLRVTRCRIYPSIQTVDTLMKSYPQLQSLHMDRDDGTPLDKRTIQRKYPQLREF
jgi:hypothetical protein